MYQIETDYFYHDIASDEKEKDLIRVIILKNMSQVSKQGSIKKQLENLRMKRLKNKLHILYSHKTEDRVTKEDQGVKKAKGIQKIL